MAAETGGSARDVALRELLVELAAAGRGSPARAGGSVQAGPRGAAEAGASAAGQDGLGSSSGYSSPP